MIFKNFCFPTSFSTPIFSDILYLNKIHQVIHSKMYISCKLNSFAFFYFILPLGCYIELLPLQLWRKEKQIHLDIYETILTIKFFLNTKMITLKKNIEKVSAL